MANVNPKVVVIGGGTGLSTMLRGLKKYTSDITAIVTVADDGGGSGRLREELGILPPGDIRNCILALANTEPMMERLLQYRFEEGELKGQSFGNLFLAAMNGISISFEEAVRNMSMVLAVKGKVLPVTLENISLSAKLENGMIVKGESKIPEFVMGHNTKIKQVYLNPSNPKTTDECLYEIKFADAIVLGPGSLYTSVIPNLLVEGIADAVRKSSAVKIYVSNIMTQPGETAGYSLNDHLRAIYNHAGEGIINYAIANSQKLPDNIIEKYAQDGADLVLVDKSDNNSIEVVEENLLQINGELVRHNPEKLADCIVNILYKRNENADCKIYGMDMREV